MAAPSYVAGGTFVNTATKDVNLAVSPPAGFSAGQHAYMQVQTVEQGSGNTAPSIVGPGADWTLIGSEILASGFANTRQVRSRIYHRVLQAGDTSWNVQMTGGTAVGVNLSAKISTFSDVGTTVLGTGTTGDAATITLPGVTTTKANSLVVAFVAIADGNTVSAQDFADVGVTGETERHDHTVGSRVGVSMATATRAAAGASGNFTATPSATDPWAGIVMAFEEASVGGASYWSAGTFGPDCEVYVTVATKPPDGQRFSLAYRIQSPGTSGVDCYVLQVKSVAGSDEWRLQVGTNQVFTTIGALTLHEIANGDQVGVKVVGSEHFFYHKPAAGSWALVGQRTDATHGAAGYVGFDVDGTVGRLDDFGAGTLSTTAIPGTFDIPITVAALTALTSWVDISSLAVVDFDVSVSARVGDTDLDVPPSGPSGDPARWLLDITNRAGVVVAQFEPQSFRITDTLNVGMSMEGIARADAPGAASLSVQERVVRAWRRTSGGGVGVERTLRFAGHVHAPLTDTGDANGAEMVQFIARDPFAALAWRYVSSHLSWGDESQDVYVDIGVIASDLAGAATEYEPGVDPFLITSDHGLRVTQVQPSVSGANGVDPGKQFAEAIIQLAELETGFWFRIEALEMGAGFGAMKIYAPLPGVARNAARFEYGPRTLANLSSFRVDTQMVINAVSVFGGNNIVVKVFDQDSIDQYGLWETTLNFSDVYDPRALRAHGNEAMRPDPVQTFSCEVATGAPSAPMLWDSFNVGDSVPLYIRGERVNVDRMVTVTSATVEVDENGDESLASLVLEAR